ncbi:MAG: hypothetical protein MN733_07520 [Nitrososphaera sp.]|nr:hypothetical protein [Nitrososphaera sp.]
MSPVYLYKHNKPTEFCRPEFEVQQNIKEDAHVKCPYCGNPVTRLIAGSVSVTWKSGAPTPKNYR